MQSLPNTDNSESSRDLLPGINQKTNHQIQARKDMAFVNEYATDEDIEKYNLYGIWDKYHPLRKGKYYSGKRPAITINREKNIFLLKVGGSWEDVPSRSRFLLWINGSHTIIDLNTMKGKGLKVLDSNYIKKWDLVGIYPEKDINLSENEIISILKEALVIYGLLGVYNPKPDINVEFNF